MCVINVDIYLPSDSESQKGTFRQQLVVLLPSGKRYTNLRRCQHTMEQLFPQAVRLLNSSSRLNPHWVCFIYNTAIQLLYPKCNNMYVLTNATVKKKEQLKDKGRKVHSGILWMCDVICPALYARNNYCSLIWLEFYQHWNQICKCSCW